MLLTPWQQFGEGPFMLSIWQSSSAKCEVHKEFVFQVWFGRTWQALCLVSAADLSYVFLSVFHWLNGIKILQLGPGARISLLMPMVFWIGCSAIICGCTVGVIKEKYPHSRSQSLSLSLSLSLSHTHTQIYVMQYFNLQGRLYKQRGLMSTISGSP